MRHYNNNASKLRFAAPSTKLFLLGAAVAALAGILFLLAHATALAAPNLHIEALMSISRFIKNGGIIFAVASLLLFAAAIVAIKRRSDADRICQLVCTELFLPENGNPLHFKDGDRLPRVSCTDQGNGIFNVILTVSAVSIENIESAASRISAGLRHKYEQYAVTDISADDAFNEVVFTVENVKIDRTIYAKSVSDLLADDATKLNVQQNAQIDLTTSGSMLVAGKTRSGKTTGVISLLLQVLAAKQDKYGSVVTIIDPKQAELSRLPHVVTLDEDGEARGILEALRVFEHIITTRQQSLNRLSEKTGTAVKWWDANMKAALIFIDEFVACRSLFPTKADPDYCLAEFDRILKRIVTMGASAGCYAIISVAEASVEQGGLPAMVRSACSTKVLFRPTVSEARFMWDTAKLETMPARNYCPGDAWFSSTDGVHDRVSCVHFPVMQFPEYEELGRLLEAYYTP